VPNRLVASTSPYLLQHAGNPVDWWEWGDDAFAEALRRDVPILLSVGYAACHWCHVMAHESFEDDATAAQMNAAFVNVKVDREERPDVDAVYMEATQALTGQGGWPMTVFLTPQGRPFYAGTYFPPRPAHGMPSFRQLLTAIAETWQGQRSEVEDAGERIATALAEQTAFATVGPDAGPPGEAATEAAVRSLAAAEDTEHGGLGGAPKFPPSAVCEFLLRHAARRPAEASGEVALGVAGRTLAAMARSGMYDQVAGGFARYAVDRAWVVPHFEKMLYDNAQLARVYLHWWRLTGDATGVRVAEETCRWMLEALRTPQGGFASSLDADTGGTEGATYVWTPAQLSEVLGEADGAWAADLLGVTGSGTFEHGTSTARLTRDPYATVEDAARWSALRARLKNVRAMRPQPGRDDKVVAAWNGLAVAAFAEVGALVERPELVAAAEAAADLLLGTHVVDGRLRRVSRDGVVGAPRGVLEDYGDVAEGLLTLHAVTGAARWLTAAGELLDVVLADFRDAADDRTDGGTWHDTAAAETDAALRSVRRPHDPTDNAYPSGTSAAAGALLSYAALTGSSRHREAAESALAVAGAAGARAPRAFGWALAVAEAALDGPREVAVAGPDGDELRARLHRVALAGTAPGAVVSAGPPEAAGVPLLAGRTTPGGTAAAYVCRNFTCRLPTSDPQELAAQLR
jgi:uncharacterized protein YyaL (SSP411 family)